MREAALNASTYQEPMQKAVAFHEQRIEEIVNGDHELKGASPRLVAHMIPAGLPSPDSLSVGENIGEQLPHFERNSAWTTQHKYGQITTRAHEPHEQRAYNLRTHAGGLETVSALDFRERGSERFLTARHRDEARSDGELGPRSV